MNSENYSLESSLKEGCQTLNEAVTEGVRELEDTVRSTPLIAVAVAAFVGYLLRFLPIFGILKLLIRLALFSIKPVVVLFAGYKLYEYIRKQGWEIRSSGEGEKYREPLLDSPSGPSV